MHIAKVNPRRLVAEAPVIIIPDNAGFEGEHRMLVQVIVSFHSNKVSGLGLNCGSTVIAGTNRVTPGKWHRLEVARAIPLSEYESCSQAERDEVDDTFSRKPGPKREDISMRPLQRMTFVLDKAGPHGLQQAGLMHTWAQALAELEAGLEWLHESAMADKMGFYGLTLACEIGAFSHKNDNPNWPAYNEAYIVGLAGASVQKLTQPWAGPLLSHEEPTPAKAPALTANSFSDEEE